MNEPLRSRTKAGHTQREAAKIVRVAYRTWQDWEQGITEIPANLLALYRHRAGLERIPFGEDA